MPAENAPDGLSEKAHANAANIENLAKNRLDAGGEAIDASMSLARAWGNLTQSERNEAAQALNKDYNNHKWDALPIPQIEVDAAGNCSSIYFKASKLDFDKHSKTVHVANDGEVGLFVSASG